MNQNWNPINDYETDPKSLEYSELRALSNVWQERRSELEKRNSFNEFKNRLHREWAIETGLIERLYTLDRGITELLIEKGIRVEFIPNNNSNNPERVANMIKDHESAIDWIFDFVKGNRSLSIAYIKELHSLMTQHQESTEAIDQFGKLISIPLIRGKFKEKPNNPRRTDGAEHFYCPPEHVDSEMDRLIELHNQHNQIEISPEVEAAWLHHRFTSIHPFQDGNGRVARAIASLVFIKAGWFPIVVRDIDQDKYIGALESADQGSLLELVDFFAELQKKNFVSALTIAQEAEKDMLVDDAIEATKRRIRLRQDSLEQEWKRACEIADHLCDESSNRMVNVSKALHREFGVILKYAEFYPDSEKDQGSRDHYFHKQIVETAKALDYYANTRAYRSWAKLVMQNGIRGEFLVSFHGLGYEFNGLLACSAMWFERSETEDGQKETTNAVPLSGELFVINYKKSLKDARERFTSWLDKCIVQALSYFEQGVLSNF